jgi:hypothetical protein
VAQQGTFSPDSSNRWMGSTAMDSAGDQAIGYSVVNSSTLDPTVRIAGRTPSDPSGTMETEVNVVTGTGVQEATSNRWGDYSALQVDPVDDCTFWYTQEYEKTTGSFNWATRIANFKFSNCGSSTPDFTISASPSSVTVQQGHSGTSTISTTALNGFNNAITLSASGQPNGVTVTFGTNPIPAPGTGSSLMTMAVGAGVAPGTYPITVTGVGGGITHTTTVSLTVTGVTPDFSISASPASVTVARGGAGTSTISTTALNGFNAAISLSASGQAKGVAVSFSPNPIAAPGTGSSVMTIMVSRNARRGTNTITVTGTGGGVTHNTSVTLTIQ